MNLEPKLARIKRILEGQGLFQTMGAVVEEIADGRLVMALPFRPEVAQQHGFFHGGATGFLVDNATTAAAGTVVEDGASVLTAEYKVNLIAPALGARLTCHATVLRRSRSLVPVEAKVYTTAADGTERLTAVGLASIAVIAPATVAARQDLRLSGTGA